MRIVAIVKEFNMIILAMFHYGKPKRSKRKNRPVSLTFEAGAAGGSSGTAPKKQFGVSRDSKTFTNASGQTSRVQYARNYNLSKGRRFRGYTDAQGNYHDID